MYGSLYPWHFAWIHPGEHPLRTLLNSWAFGSLRSIARDILINVAIYVPIGAVGHLALRRHRSSTGALAGPILLGALISIGVETLQTFQPLRTSSVVDVVANVAGSGIGVGLGIVLAHRIHRTRHLSRRDPVAAALVVIWIAWLIFPAVPVLSSTAIVDKVRIFSSSSVLQPVRIFTMAVVWFAAGRLLSAEGLKHPSAWAVASVVLIPAQLFVAMRQPLLSDAVGAAAGVVLYRLRPESARFAAALFIGCLALRGLAPFEWAASAKPMSWIPFAALLSADWQRAALVLLEKCFFYGTAIWSLQAAGMRIWLATAPIAALLWAIELLQTRIAGRTPDVTDPIIAVLLAAAFSASRR